MISGRQALAHIEQTIEKMRRQEAQLEQDYAAATEEVGRLRLQLTESFRELARLKMDALKQEQVVGQLDAAERQALNLLNSRREALRQLTERRRQAEERVQAEAARQTAVDALEKILEQVETIRRNVEAKVSIDAEWITARARSTRSPDRLSRPRRRPCRQKPTGTKSAAPTKKTNCSCTCGTGSSAPPSTGQPLHPHHGSFGGARRWL